MYSCSYPKRHLVKTQSKQPGLLRRGGSKCRFCHHHRQCRHHQPVQASENRFTIHLNRSKCMRAVRIAGCWSSLLLRRGPRGVGYQEWHCADRQPISGIGCTRCDCNPCHRSPNTANIIRLRCCILISSTIAFAAVFIHPDLRRHQFQPRQRRVHAAHVCSCGCDNLQHARP